MKATYTSPAGTGYPTACGEDLEAEASTVAARLESDYDDTRLQGLVANGGLA